MGAGMATTPVRAAGRRGCARRFHTGALDEPTRRPKVACTTSHFWLHVMVVTCRKSYKVSSTLRIDKST
jgi:hypothetical protein